MTTPEPGTLVGYIRVSSIQQTHDAQRDALTTLGCARIFEEKIGGQRADRPQFLAMLEYVRPGDVVVVTSLDRFGRSLSGVVNTVCELGERGIYVRALRESIDTSTAVGRMLAGIFASLAEYERELIKERAAVARAAAMERGKLPGRPHKLSPDDVRKLRTLRNGGESISDLCAHFSIGRSTVYRILAA